LWSRCLFLFHKPAAATHATGREFSKTPVVTAPVEEEETNIVYSPHGIISRRWSEAVLVARKGALFGSIEVTIERKVYQKSFWLWHTSINSGGHVARLPPHKDDRPVLSRSFVGKSQFGIYIYIYIVVARRRKPTTHHDGIVICIRPIPFQWRKFGEFACLRRIF
jgi:hypothetical protein